jgi:serine/threonine protein phosphatase PrpC
MTDSFWDNLQYMPRDSTSYKTRLFAECQRDFSVAQTNGKRSKMEDLFIGGPDEFVFAVFDGANGKLAATTAHTRVMKRWHKFKDPTTFQEDVSKLFSEIQTDLTPCQEIGNSATTALVADLTQENKVRVANLGDGRALLVSKQGHVRQITTDHHISNQEEVAAAIGRGGVMFRGRLDGVLLVTRSFGVPHYHASAVPDIHIVDLDENDAWLILASDGIFEKLENDRVGQLCIENKDAAASSIVNEAIAKGVDDNSTVLCIRLPSF